MKKENKNTTHPTKILSYKRKLVATKPESEENIEKLTGDTLHQRSGNLTENPCDDQRKRKEATVCNPCRPTADPRHNCSASITCACCATWCEARSCPHLLLCQITKFECFLHEIESDFSMWGVIRTRRGRIDCEFWAKGE